MKYKIGDKVISTMTNDKLTIRDILPNPVYHSTSQFDDDQKVYYFLEKSSWLYEADIEPDYQWIREQKLKELGI